MATIFDVLLLLLPLSVDGCYTTEGGFLWNKKCTMIACKLQAVVWRAATLQESFNVGINNENSHVSRIPAMLQAS
eukprot:scaffold14459_cov75-Skeletonema_marinoi.AAC.1